MTTEQYSIGYEAGYQDGWNAATDTHPAPQPKAEQEPVIGTKTWFEDGKLVTQNLTAADIYKAEQQEPERKLVADAERYRWLAEHPNEWRLYRKHGKHKLPFRMMRDGDPWGQSFATADEAVDAARSKT